MTTHRTTHLLSLAAAAALSLGLTACGTETTGAPTPPSASADVEAGATATDATAHNASDVAFAQGMVVHHEGAIVMAEQARDRAGSPEVRDLAERISAAQGPEIETMNGWLESWGEDPADGSMAGHDTSTEGHDMPMDGMSDMEGMTADLEGASGAEFDRMWLTAMIAHHEDAVEMSRVQQEEGENADALDLAASIQADQTAEITEMNRLLEDM